MEAQNVPQDQLAPQPTVESAPVEPQPMQMEAQLMQMDAQAPLADVPFEATNPPQDCTDRPPLNPPEPISANIENTENVPVPREDPLPTQVPQPQYMMQFQPEPQMPLPDAPQDTQPVVSPDPQPEVHEPSFAEPMQSDEAQEEPQAPPPQEEPQHDAMEPILPQTDESLEQMMSFEDSPQSNEQETSYDEAPNNEQMQEVASPEAILPAQISPEVPENAGVMQSEVAQDEELLPPNIPEDSPLNDVQHESMMIDQTQQQEQVQFEPESHVEQVQSVQSGEDQMMMMMQGRNITDIMGRIEDQQAVEQQVDMRAMHPNNNNNNNVDASLAAPQDIKEQLPEPMDTDDAEMYTEQIPTTTQHNVMDERGAPKETLIPELVLCQNLLDEFMKRVETEPFNEPVDWKGLNLPDYPLIITHPMDLGTVADRLDVHHYSSADKFASDVRLVFKNAKSYNMVGSGIYLVADSLLKQFERRYARITKNLSNKKRKSMDMKNGEASTYKERQTFTAMIQQLSPPELGGVVEIIDKKCPMALTDNYGADGCEDELEIEVYHINGTTLRDLIVHIEKTIAKRAKKKKQQAYY